VDAIGKFYEGEIGIFAAASKKLRDIPLVSTGSANSKKFEL